MTAKPKVMENLKRSLRSSKEYKLCFRLKLSGSIRVTNFFYWSFFLCCPVCVVFCFQLLSTDVIPQICSWSSLLGQISWKCVAPSSSRHPPFSLLPFPGFPGLHHFKLYKTSDLQLFWVQLSVI